MNGNDKKILRLKPKTSTSNDESGVARRAKKRIIRREDIPAEKLTNAKPPRRSSANSASTRHKKPPNKEKALTPAEQQAVEITNKLFESSPTWAGYKPLALGIQDMLKAYFDDLGISTSKRVLHRVLWHHTHQKEYLAEVLKETHRYLLDGSPAGEIKEAEREHAKRTLDALMVETKSASNPRPNSQR